MWCLMRPSFADIGHKMLTLWALAIMLAIQAGALDLPTTPSQLGAPPYQITSGLPVHFLISVPDPQVPRISSIRKGSPPQDVQLAPQEPDVHPWPNTLCLAANSMTVSKIHFTCTALTFYPFTHAFHLQAQRLVTPSGQVVLK